MEDGFGYIRIAQFQSATGREVRRSLEKLTEEIDKIEKEFDEYLEDDKIKAILDWEFSFSGTGMLDIGQFIRNENYITKEFERHKKEDGTYNNMLVAIDHAALFKNDVVAALPPCILITP